MWIEIAGRESQSIINAILLFLRIRRGLYRGQLVPRKEAALFKTRPVYLGLILKVLDCRLSNRSNCKL